MKGSVLVIGAGVAGMRASSELVQQGFKVFLVEKKPTIGGKMGQIDKMFPSNECSTCTILPKMLDLTSNPDNISIIAFAEVDSIEGEAGDFKVKVTKKPRYVDPMKCTACTDCFPVCPVGGVPMEYNLGRGASKAITFYSPFPPRKAIIFPDKCDYLLKGKCGNKDIPPCIEACKPEAIDFNQKAAQMELNVGAVIIATGMEELNGKALEKYGYGKFPNILTALEYERLLSGLGPTGGLVKRDDGIEPGNITWYMPDSSSPIPFMTAVTEALGTRERNANAKLSILYEDMNIQREDYNIFYNEAMDKNIDFMPINSLSVKSKENGNVLISCADNQNKKIDLETEMFILVPPSVSSQSTRKLVNKLGLAFEQDLFKRRAGDDHPLHTSREGIFVCGNTLEARGIDDAVVQACSSSANIASLLSSARGMDYKAPAKKQFMPVKAGDEPKIAVVICRCGANIAGVLDINELADYCKTIPHVRHVEITPFGCDGIKVKELLGTKEFNRMVIGACSPKTHENLFALYAENAGLNRYLMEIVNLRNHCTWVHSKDKSGVARKAKTLMRMGINRSALHEALEDIRVPVTQSCLVIGKTLAGIACSIKLSEMGYEVHLAGDTDEFTKLKDVKMAQSLFNLLEKCENIKIYNGTKISTVQGYVGNYKTSLVNSKKEDEIDIGAIVIATNEDLSSKSGSRSYEDDLMIKRNENDRFVGALGNLNPLDFTVEGVFRCGAARSKMGLIDALIDGEACASRVGGIISKKEIVKDPAISVVLDENCDGCAYCIDPCPANAISLIEYILHDGTIKKTVETNEAICKGCGICMSTCPKQGIYVRHYKPEHFETMIKSVLEVS